METMTLQQLREYDHQNIQSIETQWDIYMINGAESIKQIEMKEIESIELNQIVKIGVSKYAYILVQKMTGTALKELLKKRNLLYKLYYHHSIMMIHRTKMPMFYNMNSQKIYYCKRIRAYKKEQEGKKCYYRGKSVENGGHFEWFIHDTRNTWKSEMMDHHVYYMIVTKGSNKHDGTNKFVETSELTGDEFTIRQIQKDIVNILVKPRHFVVEKQKMNQISLSIVLKVVLSVLIFVIFHFAKIEIIAF